MAATSARQLVALACEPLGVTIKTVQHAAANIGMANSSNMRKYRV